MLGLALTAGATLTTVWKEGASLIIAGTGLVPNGPIENAVTMAVLVLLPPILLLFHGYVYKNRFARLIGAGLFAMLALAFLVEPIGYALPLSGQGVQMYRWLMDYKEVIIGLGVILAVVDIFLTKPAALSDKKKK